MNNTDVKIYMEENIETKKEKYPIIEIIDRMKKENGGDFLTDEQELEVGKMICDNIEMD